VRSQKKGTEFDFYSRGEILKEVDVQKRRRLASSIKWILLVNEESLKKVMIFRDKESLHT